MVSPTWWTWLWASARIWWRTGNKACCSPWGHKGLDMTEWLNDNILLRIFLTYVFEKYWSRFFSSLFPFLSPCSINYRNDNACGTWASVLEHVESFQARDQTGAPCIARQILNHWTTRKKEREWKPLSHIRLFATPWTNTVHGILQARILEWIAFSFSRGSSQPRDRTQVSCIAGGGFSTSWATRKTPGPPGKPYNQF